MVMMVTRCGDSVQRANLLRLNTFRYGDYSNDNICNNIFCAQHGQEQLSPLQTSFPRQVSCDKFTLAGNVLLGLIYFDKVFLLTVKTKTFSLCQYFL